jgi:membrane protease YdiL (CAAX protease family)
MHAASYIQAKLSVGSDTGAAGPRVINEANAPQTSPDASPASADQARISFGIRAYLYLVAIVLAESVTVLVDTRWGIAGHAVILALLVTQAGVAAFHAGLGSGSTDRSEEGRQANFLISVALVPLIRIVSLAMPLTNFPEWAWYSLISVPLLAAAWAGARACGYNRSDLGLRQSLKPIPLLVTGVIGVAGIPLGYLEYQILEPAPIIDELALLPAIAAAFSLILGTGLTEELIFRGMLQVSGAAVFGEIPAIIFASTTFAILHIGHKSAINVAYVFVVAIGFGLQVRRTRSIVGVTITHSVTNLCLYIFLPHYLGA